MHVAPHLLLAKNVGNVVGSEGTRAVRLNECSRDSVRAVFTNEREQFADLTGERAIRIGETAQIVFRFRPEQGY